jgi:hypothetical protein
MQSSGTRARLHLAVTGALCVLVLGACSASGGSGTSGGSGASSTTAAATSAATAAGTSAATAAATSAATAAATNARSKACTLLTKAEVAKATAGSIAFAKQANAAPVSSCTFGSLSGFAVVLSVTTSPAAGLNSDIPGLGNLVTKDHLTRLSGIGDQAYGGPDAIIARKGNTVFAIVYATFGGGNHEQALKAMATDVVARL